MATNVQSVFDYLTVTELLTTLNRERLKEIRSTYDQLKSAQYGGAATNVDELVKMLTQKFFIVDDIENLDRLKRCVTEDYFEVACQTLLNEYLTKLRQERMNARKVKSSPDVVKTQIVENRTTQTTIEIMALSVKLGRPVVIFRNGQYDMTIGDSQAGEPLKVDYLENKAGSIGHYSDNDTQNTTVITGPMNCLYDRISEQTNIPSNELRQMAANSIRENADHYIKMLPAANNNK
ncbi:unnamed protein product [Rotaria sp. Silwood1]|nr:unnamed protein product [Rotaria sp. Silwood1]